MDMYKEFFYDSCGGGRLHACRWEPGCAPRAIVQIVHGIAEYAARYDALASFLAEQGFLVVAEDHMGHGGSISEDCPQGYFTGGWFAAVKDTYQLLSVIREEFPQTPYILYGHSMGSFMARTILQEYPNSGITGCVICGTGWMPGIVLKTGLQLCKTICRKFGEKSPNEMLNGVVFGVYNKRVERPRTAHDWLSRDAKQVDIYESDPLCGFIPSAGLLRDMLTGILHIQNKKNLDKMDKELPVYFISGGEDPVGDYGKGVRKAVARFEECGMQNVTCKIFPLCRHEIHNEINYQEVYASILNWIGKLI